MKLAHLSDLHLLSLEGARILDFANKRWIGGLNLLANRGRHYHNHIFEALIEDLNAGDIDEVLVTGDITNLALRDEFRFARELFDRIELGPEHVFVIPGNHDAYVEQGATYFSEYFADYCAPDAEFSVHGPWPAVRVRGPLALLGLSTSLETPWFTAYGVVGGPQLAALRSLLVDSRFEGVTRVVAIHHPPAGPPAQSRVRGLRDRDDFAAVLADCGADLVVHGHEHRDLEHSLSGPNGAIPVHGIQSGTYEANRLDRRARYRIYEIEERGITGETMRVWDPQRRVFVADPDGTRRRFAATA